MTAHMAHAVHCSASVTDAGLYPFALSFCLSIDRIFLGHTVTHNSQPLQIVSFIVTRFCIIATLSLYNCGIGYITDTLYQ